MVDVDSSRVFKIPLLILNLSWSFAFIALIVHQLYIWELHHREVVEYYQKLQQISKHSLEISFSQLKKQQDHLENLLFEKSQRFLEGQIQEEEWIQSIKQAGLWQLWSHPWIEKLEIHYESPRQSFRRFFFEKKNPDPKSKESSSYSFRADALPRPFFSPQETWLWQEGTHSSDFLTHQKYVLLEGGLRRFKVQTAIATKHLAYQLESNSLLGEEKQKHHVLFFNQLNKGVTSSQLEKDKSFIRSFNKSDNRKLRSLIYKKYVFDNKEALDLFYPSLTLPRTPIHTAVLTTPLATMQKFDVHLFTIFEDYTIESTAFLSSLIFTISALTLLITYLFGNYILSYWNNRQQIYEEQRFKINKLLNYDNLTGALKRNYFLQMTQPLTSKEQNYSIIFLDIDFFKKINDEYGHNVGDLILIALARELHHILGLYLEESYFLGRWGGEEFVIFVPQHTKWTIAQLCETIRRDVTLLEGQGRIPPFTISIGVADSENSKIIHHVIKKADQALYEAKRSGRNMVIFADN